MATEIERKFLVVGDAWRAAATARIRMRQGYLTREGPSSVRVRIAGDEARFNLKSAEIGTTRLEFDWAVPRDEAEQILDRLCHRPLIEKVRHLVHRPPAMCCKFAGNPIARPTAYSSPTNSPHRRACYDLRAARLRPRLEDPVHRHLASRLSRHRIGLLTTVIDLPRMVSDSSRSSGDPVSGSLTTEIRLSTTLTWFA